LAVVSHGARDGVAPGEPTTVAAAENEGHDRDGEQEIKDMLPDHHAPPPRGRSGAGGVLQRRAASFVCCRIGKTTDCWSDRANYRLGSNRGKYPPEDSKSWPSRRFRELSPSGLSRLSLPRPSHRPPRRGSRRSVRGATMDPC